MKRRDFIKGLATGAAVSATGITPSQAKLTSASSDVSRFAPTALKPEFTFDEDNQLQVNPEQRTAFTMCYGCYSTCSVRARIDNETGKVLRVLGNPYGPGATEKPFDLTTSPKDAFTQLSAINDQGLQERSALCPRGNAVVDAMSDPHRLTHCLKRVGKRGEGKWETISYEQMLKEVTNGGNLFGEGHVDGLKKIYSLDQLANDNYPDFGPHKNRLLTTYSSAQHGREGFFMRFARDSWGTPNIGTKSAYCGVKTGSLGIKSPFSLDTNNCEYAIYFGHSPGMTGDNRNIIAKRLGNSNVRDNFKCVIVDPILRSNTISANKNNEWIGIKPGADTILIFGLLQQIINNEWYRSDFISIPGRELANQQGEINFSNSTHLVVTDKNHNLFNKFLTSDAVGLAGPVTPVFINKENGEVTKTDELIYGEIIYKGEVTLTDGSTVNVASSMALLKDRMNERTPQEYATQSNVPLATIEKVAKEFTSHGRRAAAVKYVGSSNPDGSQHGFALGILNTLIGSHNAKGGVIYGAGGTFSGKFGALKSPLYNLMDFDVAKTQGTSAERNGRYENSHEYNEKLRKGESLYPSNQPWLAGNSLHHSGLYLTAHANQNPYQFKCWINWNTNPFYGCAGLQQEVEASVVDPKQLGLMIGIDGYINETNRFSDYLVPDPIQYENWALGRMGASYVKGDVVSVPIIEPQTVKTAGGQHVCMEQFLIDIAKHIGLNGFGDNAFKDTKGNPQAIHNAADYYVPYIANIAHASSVLPSATDEDLKLTSADRVSETFKARLKAEEVGPALFLISRGGRYEPVEEMYDGEFFSKHLRASFECKIYDEKLTTRINSYTGKPFEGLPVLDVPRFWNQTPFSDLWPASKYPFTLAGFKSALRSPYSAVLPRITALGETNFVQMNIEDAENLGIADGSDVYVKFPNGKKVKGIVQADTSVAKGVVSIGHGFGHTALGASDVTIDGTVRAGIKARSGGISINYVSASDPTVDGAALLRENYTGASIRNVIPITVEKA